MSIAIEDILFFFDSTETIAQVTFSRDDRDRF